MYTYESLWHSEKNYRVRLPYITREIFFCTLASSLTTGSTVTSEVPYHYWGSINHFTIKDSVYTISNLFIQFFASQCRPQLLCEIIKKYISKSELSFHLMWIRFYISTVIFEELIKCSYRSKKIYFMSVQLQNPIHTYVLVQFYCLRDLYIYKRKYCNFE